MQTSRILGAGAAATAIGLPPGGGVLLTLRNAQGMLFKSVPFLPCFGIKTDKKFCYF